ncbi:unnamed protein product, partial [Ectocarpus sp. 13 AM-2016]
QIAKVREILKDAVRQCSKRISVQIPLARRPEATSQKASPRTRSTAIHGQSIIIQRGTPGMMVLGGTESETLVDQLKTASMSFTFTKPGHRTIATHRRGATDVIVTRSA